MLKKILNRYRLGKFITENFQDMEDFEIGSPRGELLMVKGHYKLPVKPYEAHTFGYSPTKNGKKLFVEMVKSVKRDK